MAYRAGLALLKQSAAAVATRPEGHLCYDAPRPLCRDKLRPIAASPGGTALDDPLQLSRNIRCFSNMRTLPSSASSSDSAISVRWPVSSACLTITRWRASWTANSAICRLACARCAKRNQACAWPSRVALFLVLKGGRDFHALSRIALIFFCLARHEFRPLCTLHDKWDQGTVPGGTVKANL